MRLAPATFIAILVAPLLMLPVSAQPPVYEPTNTAPVFVEPYTVDPWANASPDEVVLVDAPGMPPVDMGVPEQSPAQQDLGNLIPPGARKSFFQKANLGAAWIPQFESDGLGVTQINTNIVTALPFPKRHQPLVITPGYTVRFLEGPDFIDVPSRLHDADITFNHIRRITDQWVFNGSVTLGVYADDHSFSAGDAFRVSGYGFGIYETSPNSKWLFGAVYVNRAGTTVIPAVGYLFWTDDLKIDVVLPRPKIAWRTWSCGPDGYDERWFYFQGDFGGGIWAVERASGTPDTLSYSDLRVMFGTERKQIGGISRRWEVGFVFNRELEYDTTPGTLEIDNSMFVRGVLTY